MKTSLRDTAGNVLKEIDLSDTVYAAAPNPDLLHQAFVYHQANQRQGTHDTLTRGDVSGGGRKPWIQKHTGRARQGSTRSPQWRGGGVAFGPHPRSYRKRLPIRMRRQALRCALSGKAAGERLIVVDELNIADGKTKQMAQVLRALEASKSALVVLREPQPSVTRAIRNGDIRGPELGGEPFQRADGAAGRHGDHAKALPVPPNDRQGRAAHRAGRSEHRHTRHGRCRANGMRP